jgi:hypothetical protein
MNQEADIAASALVASERKRERRERREEGLSVSSSS